MSKIYSLNIESFYLVLRYLFLRYKMFLVTFKILVIRNQNYVFCYYYKKKFNKKKRKKKYKLYSQKVNKLLTFYKPYNERTAVLKRKIKQRQKRNMTYYDKIM